MPQQRNTIGIPTLRLSQRVQDPQTRRALEELAQETTQWLQRIAEGVDTATGLRGEPAFHAAVNAKDNRITKLGVPKDDTDAQMKGLALGRAGFGSTYWDAKNMPIRNLPKDVAASQADATLTQEQIRAIIAEELRTLSDTLIAEPYVTVAASGLLTAERALAIEAAVLTLTDAGANSTITVGIAANGVTNTKLRDSGALSVVGRSTNSTGDPADISAVAASDAVLRESGSVLGFGTVATAGIADNAVTDAKLRDSGALSVIGRSAGSSGDPADISAVAASDAVLRESGSVLGFGTVATAGIADNAVTDTKLRDSAATSVIGRSAGSSGDPADIAASADGQVLRRSGGSVAFGAVDIADTDAVTGILAIANGGTNSSTSLSNSRIMVSSAGTIVEAAALTNGQLLIGSTAAAPVAAALTQGSAITITNAAGSITVALSGSAQTYTETNVTTDRSYDADLTTLAEVADVLGTLIADLRGRGVVA